MRYFPSRSIVGVLIAGIILLGSFALAQDSQSPNPSTDPLAKKPMTKAEQKAAKEREKNWKKEVSKTYQQWLNGAVRYIITPEEEQAFKQLSNDEERDQFIEQFWLRRDPTPDTPENEYKEEFYRRVAYANEHFAAGIPGWKTDRGRIYIIWGKPDEIDAHPSGGTYNRPMSEGGGTTSTFPFEDWRYRYLPGIGNDVILEFVDTCMCGDYHLTMNPNEKDALLYTPNAGLTLNEEMGLSSKADRITGSQFGFNPDGLSNQSTEFDNLELMAKINAPPPIKFKDLEEAVTHKIRYNLLPFEVRADFVKVTDDTVLVPITIQVKNKDITFVNKEGVERGVVNIFGRLTTITGRVAQTFEDTVGIDVPAELLPKEVDNASVYWKALPLRPGLYKLDVAVKDVNGDRMGTWTQAVKVPEFSDDKLTSSSLILADLMEKVAAQNVGAGNFVIGDTKVRPRVSDGTNKPVVFKRQQRLNLWMQVYNLGTNHTTNKPDATVEYDIVNAQTNKSVLHTVETTEQMGAKAGSQITLEKSLALASLDPGLYRVKITVNDKISGQTISPSAPFQVE